MIKRPHRQVVVRGSKFVCAVTDTKPVVVPWLLYLAICEMMSLVDSGQRTKALTALEELYADSEMGPLIRKLEEEI